MWRRLLPYECPFQQEDATEPVKCAEIVLQEMQAAQPRSGQGGDTSHRVMILDEVDELLEAINYHEQHEADDASGKTRPPATA